MGDDSYLKKKIERIQRAQESAEKLLEEKSRELFDLNKSLESQVVERTKEFESARDQAIAASKAKSQFLANMSHEIRTPLNGMLGFIGLLEKSPLTEIQKNQLSTVSKSGRLLLSIINDILEFSKIEAGKLDVDYAKFQVKTCVEDIVDVMANEAYDKGIEFPTYIDEDIPKNLLGDEARLRQVLINLVGNAVKFTPSGEVSVEVRTKGITSDGRCRLYFEVRDTGVGIPKSKLESIFSAFEQADESDTRKYGGTGLGLTISQQIVSAMGGRLQVQSEEAVGSRFFFELLFPIPEGEALDVPNKKILTNEEVAVSVLNASLEANLLSRLRGWGAVAWGVEDLEKIQWKQGHLESKNLVLDHQLFDNPEALSKVKKLIDDGAHVLVLSTPKERTALSDRLKNLKLDILSKPVKREDLLASIVSKSTSEANPSFSVVAEPAPTERAVGPCHLLLVEDNLVNQQVALAMLEAHGYTADIANNGQEAVELFDSQKHRLILMDCQMPVMDGFDATRLIREKDGTVPIVAMTANAFKKTKEQCFEAGMNDFVTKPVGDEGLASIIVKNLKLHKTAG